MTQIDRHKTRLSARRRRVTLALLAALCGTAAGPALAQASPPDADAGAHPPAEPLPPAPPREPPIKARFAWTQFVSSVIRGDASGQPAYGGKLDAHVSVPGGALGLGDDIELHLHPEFRYGESVNGAVGLLPVNSELFYPRADGEVFDLSASVSKRFASGATIAVGKFDLLETTEALPVIGGGGTEGFQNLALALPPSTIVPRSILGAMATVPAGPAQLRLWLFDPQPQSRRTGFENPFARGVTALGAATFPARIGGQPGFYTLKAIGSTRKGANFNGFPPPLIPAVDAGFESRKGAWALAASFQQFVVSHAEHPGKGIGLFGEIALLDGHPTPLDFHAFFGVSGNPAARPRDTFGIAWFHYSLSDRLVTALADRVPLKDEWGFEAFYTVQIGKPFRLTADAQLVRSAVAARRTGVILGLRLNTGF